MSSSHTCFKEGVFLIYTPKKYLENTPTHFFSAVQFVTKKNLIATSQKKKYFLVAWAIKRPESSTGYCQSSEE